jgi:hypothetical protein
MSPIGIFKMRPKTRFEFLRIKQWWERANLFNYRIFIYNKRFIRKVGTAPKIGNNGKYLLLLQDNGQPIRHQVSMTIHDGVNKPARAIIEVFVNLEEIIKIE